MTGEEFEEISFTKAVMNKIMNKDKDIIVCTKVRKD